MGLHLNFSIDGERQISAELGVMADMLEDFSEPMEDSKKLLLLAAEDNFEQRGKRFGGWKPRKYLGDGHPLMEKSGDLRQGFYGESGKDYAFATNKIKYFEYHQSNAPRTIMPRRVMLMIDSQLRDDIFKVFQLYIIKAMRGR